MFRTNTLPPFSVLTSLRQEIRQVTCGPWIFVPLVEENFDLQLMNLLASLSVCLSVCPLYPGTQTRMNTAYTIRLS